MAAGVACFVQTCDQVITGRQFAYDRALEIIQEEEYLEDADIDDIRRYHLLKKIGNFNPNLNIPRKHEYNNWVPFNKNKKYEGKFAPKYQYKNQNSYDHYNNIQSRNGSWSNNSKGQYQTQSHNFQNGPLGNHNSPSEKNKKFHRVDIPSSPVAPPGLQSNIKKFSKSKEDTEYEPEFTDSSGNKVLSRVKRPAPPGFNVGATSSILGYQTDLTAVGGDGPDSGDFGLGALGAIGAGTIGMMAMTTTDLTFQGGGVVGGGGLPTDFSIITAPLSLALVPLGLSAVAIFPPFARPRTVPAVAVIFNEGRDMSGTIRKRDLRHLYQKIKKRSPTQLGSKIGGKNVGLPSLNEINNVLSEKHPKTVISLTKAWNRLNRFRVWLAKKMYKNLSRPMKKIVKKIARFEAWIHKKVVCLKPRLKRRYGLLVYPEGLTVKALEDKKENFKNFIENGNVEDVHVEFIEDCFDDMERPRFGWRAKITVMEKEPCVLDFENPDQNTCKVGARSSDDEDENFYAQSRQTGEGFRSAATPDCRIEYVCKAPLVTGQPVQDQQEQLDILQPVQDQEVQSDEFQPVQAQPDQPQPPQDTEDQELRAVTNTQDEPIPGQLIPVEPDPPEPIPVEPALPIYAEAGLEQPNTDWQPIEDTQTTVEPIPNYLKGKKSLSNFYF